MPLYRAKSILQLRERLRQLAPQVKVFSLDIFDTLLGRRIDPPEAVHERLAALVSEHLDQRLDPATVLALRRDEETKLRVQAAADGYDYECHYHDLLRAWVGRLAQADDDREALAAWIRDTELALEVDALVVKQGVPALLEELRASGRQVIVISDMYLGLQEIRYLLEAKGLLGYLDQVYVSSETGHCKYSGRMFRDVATALGVDLTDMVHAGDNRIADGRTPASLGLHAIHLREPAELRRRGVLERYGYLARGQNYWKGRHLLQIATCGHGPFSERFEAFYYRYGYEVLGPMFSLFTHAAVERIAEEELDAVYFLARDGYLLQRLYDRMGPALIPDRYAAAENIYLCLSRQSAAPAAVHAGMNRQEARLALYNPKQRGLESILKSFVLPVAEFAELAREHGFDPMDEPIDDWEDPRIDAFIGDPRVQTKICAHGAGHQALMRDYLAQQRFFEHRKVGFVDIGWNGTIQYFIGRAFADEPECPRVHGLYFGYCMGIPYAFHEKDRIEGLFYDQGKGFATERVVMSFEEVFEQSARASHGTTVGYERDDQDRVQPIYKADDRPDRRAELACDPIIEALQAGILDFADEYLRAIRLTGYRPGEIQPFLLSLAERALAYPTTEEVARLTRLVHTEDWGHENVMDLEEVKTTGFWRDLRGNIQRSNWRNGTVAEHAGALATWVFRYLDVIRRF